MVGALPLNQAVAGEQGSSAIAALHAEHADFVWSTLQRFGVPHGDLEDVLQEVFVVVQRRLGTHDDACPMSAWIYGICRRVAANHRRRSARGGRPAVVDLEELADPGRDPEEVFAAREAERQLVEVLDAMDLDRRAVLVMYEIDEMPCEQIAALVGVPVGTVYSRLHAARKEFAKLLQRVQARGGRP